MAKIGISRPYFALYNDDGSGKPTYKEGGRFAKAVEMDLELNNADPEVLYADNGPAESASSFAGAKLKMVVDELEMANEAKILGLKIVQSQSPAGSVVEYGDIIAPYCGFGTIVKTIKGGVVKFIAILLPKVQFQTPNMSAKTQGDKIVFQTPEIEASVMREDTEVGAWKRHGEFSTEADAEKYIKSQLNIT